MNYGFVIDNASCIGCHACSTACKSENEVPLGVYRTWVKYTEVGTHPDVRRTFQVSRCNHCSNPPCVRICPTASMHQRADGIVDFDSDACIGCKACTQACPYDAIHIDPASHTAAKCNFCAHRVDVGLEPACVVVCPVHAILAGDLDDPGSEVARAVAKRDVTVRKPEQGTAPKLFYIEGNDVALHPTAAARGAGFQWADAMDGHGHGQHHSVAVGLVPRVIGTDPRGTVTRVPESQGAPSGGPIQVGVGRGQRVASAIRVGYNAQHLVQWHWPIPAYLVTKHIAGGVFAWLACAALAPGVVFPVGGMVWGGALGLLMLAVTLGLLVYDLDRPDRFFYLLVRPQWRSWVARAAWILAGFSAVAGGWWALEVLGWLGYAGDAVAMLRPLLAVATLPLAVLAATYTAFLLAQAEGRDLWQSPHLPVLMSAQAVALGAAPFAAFGGAWGVSDGMVGAARLVFGGSVAVTLAVALVADLGVPHASEVARRAARDMVRGAFSRWYWLGIVVGHLIPLALLSARLPAADVAAFAAASVGLFLYAYALVMAPQHVPNA